jgi:hypothetical protein
VAWEDQTEEVKLAAQDHLLGHNILKYLFVGQDSYSIPRLDSAAQASKQSVCLVSFGSSSRRSGPMGCLMSPRMDSESEDERQAEAGGHAPVASSASPQTSPVRRKATHPTPPPPHPLQPFLFLWRVSAVQ